ncbi:MAG: hypothetical protein COS35_06505 [Zetaproteobacteria bacterium CG02_land_8_20_14_3_00_50_9]|nr:MAG: hypothetical protein AUJ57_07760 [Zetaproteobacteria bacterium CG1_02_53_45]PIV30491.1 MAG: hypothetical protein COS35_06505 [Zetaproteobacteria bacterium CG02_land_8_20_14_3_00_50_9]
MAYSTYADLIKKHDEQYLIQLSDDDGDGIADAVVIDEAIAQADAEINARISMRYSVPMNPVPALATSISATLAIGNLYSHRGMDKPDTVKDDVKAAIALLDRIGEGRATWGEATEPAADTAQLDVRISSQTRVFNRNNMSGF